MNTYGNTQKMVNTSGECAQQARNAGVNLFLSCQNSQFYCYIYNKTQSSTTCATIHNDRKCNVYRLTNAALTTIGKSDNTSVTDSCVIDARFAELL